MTIKKYQRGKTKPFDTYNLIPGYNDPNSKYHPFGDLDRDGVPNALDCNPTNPYEHGVVASVVGAVSSAASAVSSAAAGAYSVATGAVSSAVGAVAGVVGGAYGVATGAVSGAYGAASGAYGAVSGAVGGVIGGGAVSSTGSTAASVATGAVAAGAVGGGGYATLTSKERSWIEHHWKDLPTYVKRAYTKAKSRYDIEQSAKAVYDIGVEKIKRPIEILKKPITKKEIIGALKTPYVGIGAETISKAIAFEKKTSPAYILGKKGVVEAPKIATAWEKHVITPTLKKREEYKAWEKEAIGIPIVTTERLPTFQEWEAGRLGEFAESISVPLVGRMQAKELGKEIYKPYGGYGITPTTLKEARLKFTRIVSEPIHTVIGGKRQQDILEQERETSEAYKTAEGLVKSEWIQPLGDIVVPVQLSSEAIDAKNVLTNLQEIGRSRGYEQLDGSFKYPDTKAGRDWAAHYETAINEQNKQITPEGYYKEKYIEYTPAGEAYMDAYKVYEAEQAKLEAIPQSSLLRQFGMGAGTLIASLPGFIAFETPRIAAETVIKPSAAPAKVAAFGEGMYEFAKEKPVEFAGSLAAMWTLGGFKTPYGRGKIAQPTIDIGKMPSGAKTYSLGVLTKRGETLFGEKPYTEFYPGVTFTRGLPKIRTREPLEFGKPITAEAKTVTDFAKTHDGYVAGSKGIYYQMPKNTVRVGADHDLYFAGKTRTQLAEYAKDLQSQLGKNYEVRISKGGNAQIYNKTTGKQVVDMLTRKVGQDKIIIKNDIPVRDYKQILRDKRQIVKHVSKTDPKYAKAMADIAKTEKAVTKGEYIIREERGGISFKRYPVKSYEQLFGGKEGKWLPESPFETKLVRKLSGVEEPLIVEARGTRFYTIKSKVAAKEIRSGIIEILEREGIQNKNKVADAIIRDLKKYDADVYGSLIQQQAGKAVREPGLGRVARDIDIHLMKTEEFGKIVTESINRAAGKKVIKLKVDKHGNKVPTFTKTGQKLFDIHSKDTPGYMYGEDFLGWGLKAEKRVKTQEGISTITLSEQASRKFRGAVQVRKEEFYIIEGKTEIIFKPVRVVGKDYKVGDVIAEGTILKKGHLLPEHGGRFKDIADYYFAEKANIAGLKLRHKSVSAKKADAHLEKWIDAWGTSIAKDVRKAYKEASKEGEAVFLGSFEQPPVRKLDILPSPSYLSAKPAAVSVMPSSPSAFPSFKSMSLSPAVSMSFPLKSMGSSLSASLSKSPRISTSPYISPSMSKALSASLSISPLISPSVSPYISPSISPYTILSPSISPSPLVSPSVSPLLSPSPYISPIISPYISPSISPSPSVSPSPYISPSPSISPSPYITPIPEISPTPYLFPPLSLKTKKLKKRKIKKPTFFEYEEIAPVMLPSEVMDEKWIREFERKLKPF